MEASMRFWFKAALLVAAAALVPACKSNSKLAAPVMTAVLPTTVSGVIPNIVVQFDRPMDPATAGSASFYAIFEDPSTTSLGFAVELLPNLNEVRIIPSSILTAGKTFHVYVAGGVKSTEGTPMGNTIHFDFMTAASSGATATSFISWNGIDQATGVAQGTNPGEITLTWATNAQGTTVSQTVLGDIVANYDVYLSTTSGSEDLMLPYFFTSNTSAKTITFGGGTLVSGTTYYIKVQPRDSAGSVFNAKPLPELTAVAK
jgi:hypothetical protein